MSASAVAYAGALAVFLTAVGLYASLSAAVARRTREIGIRQAVGASPTSIVKMIVREGLAVILAGIVVGLGVALTSSRLIQHLLYGSTAGDGTFYGVSALVVAGIGLIACWIPAHRASRIQPMEALRSE